jgi:5'-nucleotidase
MNFSSSEPNLKQHLVIGISSRALFDLTQSHTIFEKDGLTAYQTYQIEHENDELSPGPAFHFIKKLLALLHPETKQPLVEVILLSRNSADTGLRIFNNITTHQLKISRAAFTNGMSPYPYLSAFDCDLFLSTHGEDVKQALDAGCPAATLFADKNKECNGYPHQIRIAFDGDAVLFSDEAEKIFQAKGLEAFQENEKVSANTPLPHGPFQGFLKSLHNIQKLFPADDCPIRTALITARNAPAHERVVRTLRNWGIRIDEALFLGGLKKGDFLKAFSADIFFDDQASHCDSASEHVTAGHVPHGISNQKK